MNSGVTTDLEAGREELLGKPLLYLTWSPIRRPLDSGESRLGLPSLPCIYATGDEKPIVLVYPFELGYIRCQVCSFPFRWGI